MKATSGVFAQRPSRGSVTFSVKRCCAAWCAAAMAQSAEVVQIGKSQAGCLPTAWHEHSVALFVWRPRGYRSRTTMPRSTQTDFAFQFGCFALYFFECCKIHTLLREFAPIALLWITHFVCVPPARMVFMTSSTRQCLDLLTWRCFCYRNKYRFSSYIYHDFVCQTSGLVRVVGLQ